VASEIACVNCATTLPSVESATGLSVSTFARRCSDRMLSIRSWAAR
jgi:hypothetical protein